MGLTRIWKIDRLFSETVWTATAQHKFLTIRMSTSNPIDVQDIFEGLDEDSYNENSNDIESLPEELPEECSLPFDQQIANIKAAYSDDVFRDCPLLPPYTLDEALDEVSAMRCPLLPPYTLDEVCAMEIKYSFSFPPLFRYYILNISRETSFTSRRSLIQPEMCRLRYRLEEQALEEHCKARGKQRFTRSDTWSHHTASHGYCGYDETIWFSGRLCAFVQLAEEMFYPHVRTLYERLVEADQSLEEGEREHIFFPTLGETLQKCHDIDFRTLSMRSNVLDDWFNHGFDVLEFVPELKEIRDVELPNELRVCCRDPVEAVGIILGHARIRRMVEELNGKARVIQRQYRLWRWRKNVLWNPDTDIGCLNLLVKARLSHVASV